MRITRRQLRQIIREQVATATAASHAQVSLGEIAQMATDLISELTGFSTDEDQVVEDLTRIRAAPNFRHFWSQVKEQADLMLAQGGNDTTLLHLLLKEAGVVDQVMDMYFLPERRADDIASLLEILEGKNIATIVRSLN